MLYDEEKDEYLVARDPIGVIPLYIGTDNAGHIMVASELKALEGYAVHYEPFLPGHYYYSKEKKKCQSFQPECGEIFLPGTGPPLDKRVLFIYTVHIVYIHYSQ